MTEEETIRKCKTYVVKDVEARMEVEGDKCHNRKRRGRNDACVLLPYWSNGFCNVVIRKIGIVLRDCRKTLCVGIDAPLSASLSLAYYCSSLSILHFP